MRRVIPLALLLGGVAGCAGGTETADGVDDEPLTIQFADRERGVSGTLAADSATLFFSSRIQQLDDGDRVMTTSVTDGDGVELAYLEGDFAGPPTVRLAGVPVTVELDEDQRQRIAQLRSSAAGLAFGRLVRRLPSYSHTVTQEWTGLHVLYRTLTLVGVDGPDDVYEWRDVRGIRQEDRRRWDAIAVHTTDGVGRASLASTGDSLPGQYCKAPGAEHWLCEPGVGAKGVRGVDSTYAEMYRCPTPRSEMPDLCTGLTGQVCYGLPPLPRIWTCDAVRHDISDPFDLSSGKVTCIRADLQAAEGCCGTLETAERSYRAVLTLMQAGLWGDPGAADRVLNVTVGPNFDEAAPSLSDVSITYDSCDLSNQACPSPDDFCAGTFQPLPPSMDFDVAHDGLVGPCSDEKKVLGSPVFLSTSVESNWNFLRIIGKALIFEVPLLGWPLVPVSLPKWLEKGISWGLDTTDDVTGERTDYAVEVITLPEAGRLKIGISGVASGGGVVRLGLDSWFCTQKGWCDSVTLTNVAQSNASAIEEAIDELANTPPCQPVSGGAFNWLPNAAVPDTGTGGNCRDLPFLHKMKKHGFGWYDVNNLEPGIYGVFLISKEIVVDNVPVFEGHATFDIYAYYGNGGDFRPVPCDAGAAVKGGTITATPNPCVFADGDNQCTATIDYTASGVTMASVWVYDGTKRSLFAAGMSEERRVPWINAAGFTFELREGLAATGLLLASVNVAGTSQATAPVGPTINVGGVAGNPRIVAGSAISLYGSNFASPTGNTVTFTQGGSSYSVGAGTTWWYESAQQINVSLPAGIVAGEATVYVTSSGIPSNVESFVVAADCGNDVCEGGVGEVGLDCDIDCCDPSTDCGVTKGNAGVLSCRSINGGPSQWVADEGAANCDQPSEVCTTVVGCGGGKVYCKGINPPVWDDGPCACGDGYCTPDESCSSCAADCGECPACDGAVSGTDQGCNPDGHTGNGQPEFWSVTYYCDADGPKPNGTYCGAGFSSFYNDCSGSACQENCYDPVSCCPGETETQSQGCDCGGSKTRTCDSSGSWGAWGACSSGSSSANGNSCSVGVCYAGECDAPTINAGGIAPTMTAIAIYGTHFASSGNQVKIGGVTASVFYESPTQVNAYIPSSASPGSTVSVQVIANGQTSNSQSFRVWSCDADAQATESQSCDCGGTKTRTCKTYGSSRGQWGSWGSCGGGSSSYDGQTCSVGVCYAGDCDRPDIASGGLVPYCTRALEIYGTHFRSSGNSVKVNGVTATIFYQGTTQINVWVPTSQWTAGASRSVTVTANGKTSSPESFVVPGC